MATLPTHRRSVTVWAVAGSEYWPHSTGKEPKRTTATTKVVPPGAREGNLCAKEAHSEADREMEGGAHSEAEGPVHQGNYQGDWDPQEDRAEVPQGRQSPDESSSESSGDVESIAVCYSRKLDR